MAKFGTPYGLSHPKLALMAERHMAYVMTVRSGSGKVRVEPEKLRSNRRNCADFNHVFLARSDKRIIRLSKNLGLVAENPERLS
jgi:hypothetical protein